MKPAERIAFRDAVARAMAWTDMTDDQRNTWARLAERVIAELETVDAQADRLGWIFVDGDTEEVES